jgi:exonuclease SbcD
MKIVICGDTHIGAVYGLGGSNGLGGNTRLDDYEKTLNYIADYCINNNIDVFIQTGDLFDKRNPTFEQINIVDSVIKKLSENNIFSAIIMGNHDYKRSGNTFSSAITSIPAKDCPNTRMVLEPELIHFSNDNGDVNLLLLPFRDRKMYNGKNNKEDSLLYQEEVKNLLSSRFYAPTIAIGHNFFFEGSYSDYGSSEVLINIDAFSGCDLVAMGHYHSFKTLKNSNPIAIYTGSMEKLNFGDAKIDKVFIEYDTITKSVNIHKTPVRDLVDLNIDLFESSESSIYSDLFEKIDQYSIKDKILRLKLTVSEKIFHFINKNKIEKELYERGAFFISKISFEQVYQKIICDTSILEYKDNFGMFSAFVESQNFEQDVKDQILLESKNILGAT